MPVTIYVLQRKEVTKTQLEKEYTKIGKINKGKRQVNIYEAKQTYRYSIAYIHKSDKGLYAFTFRAEVYLNEKKNKKDMAILLTAFLKESVRKTNLGLQRMFRDAYAQGIEAEEVSATEAERIGRYKFYFERIY